MRLLREVRQLLAGNGGKRLRARAKQLRQDLARLYLEGSYNEAAKLGEELLALQKRWLGSRHPDYATGLRNLSLLLEKADQPTRAASVLKQALEIRRATLGGDHPDTIALVQELGSLQVSVDGAAAKEPPPSLDPTELAQALLLAWPLTDDLDLSCPIDLSRPADTGARLRLDLSSLVEILADAAESAQAWYRHPGLPPSREMIEDMHLCHVAFAELRERTLRHASALKLPYPHPENLRTLVDLSTLIEAVIEEELRRKR